MEQADALIFQKKRIKMRGRVSLFFAVGKNNASMKAIVFLPDACSSLTLVNIQSWL